MTTSKYQRDKPQRLFTFYECSKCGNECEYEFLVNYKKKFAVCMNCGTRMEAEVNGDTTDSD